jgi:flagellar biosynthesis/type III secretory pathway protein FliH
MQLLSNRKKNGTGAAEQTRGSRKRAGRRGVTAKKTLLRRKPMHRKRLTQKENEQAELGQTFNDGYNTGFTKGFEDGHQAAYENKP